MGPFPLEDALRLRNNGKISDTDWAWHEGLPEWVPLTQISGYVPSGPPMPPGNFETPAFPASPQATGVAPTGIRIVTALVIFVAAFVLIFCVVAFISFVVGGAMAGGHAAMVQHAQGYEAGAEVGREAGRKFGVTYGPRIAGLSALFSLVTSLLLAWGLSFSQLLPWCRRR
jgi:NADH:ubiquinone oxidoreductase subunit 3 (subunit A)